MSAMSDEKTRRLKARESIDVPLRVLILLRYYRTFDGRQGVKDSTREKVYRILLRILLIIYNLQHIIFAFQSIGNMEHFITVMLVLISTINHLFKLYTFHIHRDRIRKLLELINGPFFASLENNDDKVLENVKQVISMLMRGVHISVYLCCILWVLAPFANRYTNGSALIPAYFPFNLDTMQTFTVAVLYKNIVIVWLGIGHVTMDCIMAAFYAQTKTQLSILRNILQRLTDHSEEHVVSFGHRDSNTVFQNVLERRFTYCVIKYEKISWYSKEVESIFNNAQILQMIMSIISLCVVMYRFVELSSLSFDTLFLALYYLSFLAQLFPFCYCGTLIEHESNFINEAIFSSDWISLSPRFRRKMIFAMLRWSRPITMYIAGVLPLSLNTFIRVLKLSYSLYTLLKETSN